MGKGFNPFVYHRDSTHKAIAEYLESKGYVVKDVSMVKNLGFDIIVFSPMHQCWRVCEIKTPIKSRAKPGARRYSMKNRHASGPRLTPSENKLLGLADVAVAETGEEAERKMFFS
jgi:hypothetical protein